MIENFDRKLSEKFVQSANVYRYQLCRCWIIVVYGILDSGFLRTIGMLLKVFVPKNCCFLVFRLHIVPSRG